MPFATARDGVKLYYEETGDGPPILFIHEFAGDWRAWEPQVSYFSRRRRCIVYSARGYPGSDIPEEEAAIRRISRVTTRWRCSIISVSTTRISWAFRWAASRRCISALPTPTERCR